MAATLAKTFGWYVKQLIQRFNEAPFSNKANCAWCFHIKNKQDTFTDC